MIIKYEEDYYDPEDDYDFTDYDDTDEELYQQFADEMYIFLMDIIKEGQLTTESFTSPNNFRRHFNKHCLGHEEGRHSTNSTIYYDFTDNSQYSAYEQEVTDRIRNTDMIIDSLDDYDNIMKYMRKLFEGDCTITFTKSCGLKGDKGPISVSFSSFSSGATSNYGRGNTIDVCIKGKGNNTVTLYPVDAHKVQNRLNNIIKNHLDSGEEDTPSFDFNND